MEDEDFIIMHWDDDDWYASNRIIRQVTPLISQEASMSALQLRNTITLDPEEGIIMRYLANDPRKGALSAHWLHGGTLAYWYSSFGDGPLGDGFFPTVKCGEDLGFMDSHLSSEKGLTRLKLIDDSTICTMYMRHAG